MNDSDRANLLSCAGAICLVCAGIALIVGAWRLGPHITAGWVIVTFQIIVTVVLIAIGGGIVTATVSSAITNVSKQIDELRAEHEELVKALQDRTPTLVVVTVLVVQAIMLLADKAFEGETLPTVMVSMALLVLFWIANEFIVAGTKVKYYLGLAIWVAAVLTLPVTVTIHRNGISNLYADLAALDLGTKLTVGIFFIACVLLPFAFSKNPAPDNAP